jgi:surface polysaccharide O-acyltransferase-like enzyme
MMFGIFLQANRVGDFSVATHVTEVSDYFRMATFFTISGFFMQMAMLRDGADPVLKRRFWVLVTPLLFCLAVVNPVTNSIASLYVAGAQPITPVQALQAALTGAPILPTPDGALLHVWFLVILIGFLALSPAFALVLTTYLPKALPRPGPLLAMLVALIAGYSVVARGLEEMLSRVLENDLSLLRVFLRYLPFFLLGMAAQMSKTIWESMHRLSLPILVTGAVLVWAGQTVPQLHEGAVGTLYYAGARAVLTTAIIAALLAIFARLFDFGTPATRLASQGVYTAYLLQLLLVWIGGAAAIELGLGGTALYLVTVLFTLIAGHAIWYFVVRRIPMLSLLLSGRWRTA